MPPPNTNLAAEFHVLSSLHRKGIDAYLTLGNKKACDIVAVRPSRVSVSVEVKAVAGSYDWRAGNLDTDAPDSHFVALVSYEGNIEETALPPRVWVIPYGEVTPLVRNYEGTRNISRAAVIATGDEYLEAWHLVSGGEG